MCVLDGKLAFRSLVTILTELYMHLRLISVRESLSSEIKHILHLTHCGPVTKICVFTLQLCETDDANLRF